MVLIQYQSGVELLACLARQSFEDGCPTYGQQVPNIALCKQRATDFSENVEVTALVPALGDLGIDAHALIAALGTAVGRVRFLFGGKREQFLADSADVDRKSTRLNSSHANISYAVFCLK